MYHHYNCHWLSVCQSAPNVSVSTDCVAIIWWYQWAIPDPSNWWNWIDACELCCWVVSAFVAAVSTLVPVCDQTPWFYSFLTLQCTKINVNKSCYTNIAWPQKLSFCWTAMMLYACMLLPSLAKPDTWTCTHRGGSRIMPTYGLSYCNHEYSQIRLQNKQSLWHYGLVVLNWSWRVSCVYKYIHEY